MLYLNSPLSFLFSVLYFFLSVSCLFFSDSLLVLWVVLELQIIIFIVISFPYFRSFHSSLVLYFLVQSVSSLMVLGFAFFSSYLVLISLSLKLGVFPFYGWYLNSVAFFPGYSLYLALTFQKLPSLIFFSLFFPDFSGLALFIVVLFSALGSFVAVSLIFSVPVLLVWSSLITNVWFFLAMATSLSCFLVYFSVYSAMVLVLVNFLDSSFSGNLGVFIMVIFSLGGFPPLPMFFVNLYVLYCSSVYFSVPLVFTVLVCSVITMYIYCKVSISSFLLCSAKL